MRYFQKISEFWLSTDAQLEPHFEKNRHKYRHGASAFFTFVHFLLGLYILWITKYRIDEHLPPDTSLGIKGLVETAWLLAGIYWGNLGWDIRKELLVNGTFRDALAHIAKKSVPIMILFPGMLHNFIIYNNIYEYGNPFIFKINSPAVQWIIASIVLLLFLKLHREISKT